MTTLAEPEPTEVGAARLRLRPVDCGSLLLALGAVSALIALLVGVEPALLVLGTVVGGVLLVAALLRPAIAMTLLVVSEFSNAGEVLAVPNFYGATLAFGILSAAVALRRPEMRARLRRPPVAPVALLACYVLGLLPAMWYTLTPEVSVEVMGYLLKDCVLLVVVLVLGHLVNRPWWIAAGIVLTLTVLSAMTVVNQLALGAAPSAFGGFATVSAALGENITTPRHAGPVSDSNFWGRNILLGLPLAYALVHRSVAAGRRLPQLGWGLAAALLLGGAYLTQSRGTLLIIGVVTVVWVVASGPRVRRRALLFAPLVAPVLLIPGISNRLVNLISAFESGPAYTVDPSLVERVAAQEIAVAMFADRPLFGTGPGSFESLVYEYASRANVLVGDTRAPHNLYLELAAESGLVGLTGWLVLVGGIVMLAGRSVIRLPGTRQDGRLGAPTRALAAGVLSAVLGWSLASLFLHLEYFRPLLIVFALAGLLHVRTRDDPARRSASVAAASANAARGLRTGSALTAVLVLAAGVVATSWLISLSEPRYTATARFTVLPAPGIYEPYSLDVRRRLPVLPAYAAMIQSGRPAGNVSVDAEPARGLITMTAAGPDQALTEAGLDQMVRDAPRLLAQFGADRGYRLVQVSPVETTVERSYPDRAITLTALAVLAELSLIALALRHFRGHRRAGL